jgi:hypothetical protein
MNKPKTSGYTTYSSRKLYKLAFQNVPTHPIFTWIWKSKCTPRVKFFTWLVLLDRLNTKVMLRRRNLFDEEDEVHCVLCTEGIDEDLDHLFFSALSPRGAGKKLVFSGTIISAYIQG